MMDMTLYTIGYGNRQPVRFFSMLPDGAQIIDIRFTPYSRWCPAYNRASLFERFGARYRWAQRLGNVSGTADRWTPPDLPGTFTSEDALFSVAETVREEPVILLCSEADYQRCHRRFVAEEIARRVPGLEIVHL